MVPDYTFSHIEIYQIQLTNQIVHSDIRGAGYSAAVVTYIVGIAPKGGVFSERFASSQSESTALRAAVLSFSNRFFKGGRNNDR
jgi:hypothetical protein